MNISIVFGRTGMRSWLGCLLLLCGGPSIVRAAEGAVSIAVIGNSMVGEGIDIGRLGQLSGTRVRVFKRNGVMSSWRYLVLKTRLTDEKLAIVVTREFFETSPHVRVGVKWGQDPVVHDQVDAGAGHEHRQLLQF